MQNSYSKRDDIMKNQLCVHRFYLDVLDIYTNYLCRGLGPQSKLPFVNEEEIYHFVQCIKYFFIYPDLYEINPYKAGPNIKKETPKSIISSVITNSNNILNPRSYTFSSKTREEEYNQAQSIGFSSQVQDLTNDSQFITNVVEQSKDNEEEIVQETEVYEIKNENESTNQITKANENLQNKGQLLNIERSQLSVPNKQNDLGQSIGEMSKTKSQSQEVQIYNTILPLHEHIPQQYIATIQFYAENINKQSETISNLSTQQQERINEKVESILEGEKIHLNGQEQELKLENQSEIKKSEEQQKFQSKKFVTKGETSETQKGHTKQRQASLKLSPSQLQEIPQIDSDQAQQERLGIKYYAQRALKLINCTFMGTFGSNQIRRRPKQQKIFVELQNVFMIFDQTGRNAFFDRANFEMFYQEKKGSHFPSGY